MKVLVRLSAITGISTITNMVILLLRVKVLAILLGPEGMGLFSQFAYFFSLVASIAGTGIGYGITGLVARYYAEDDREKISEIVVSGGILIGLVGLVITTSIALGSTTLAKAMLSVEGLGTLLLALALSMPFRFVEVLFEAILQGQKKIAAISQAKIVSSVCMLLVVVPLTFLYRLSGAVVGLAIWAFISMVIFITIYIRKSEWKYRHAPLSHFRIPFIGVILRFGIVGLLTNSVRMLALLFVRTQIVRNLGALDNGLYQVAWAASLQYLVIVTSSLWAYAFPRISELRDSPVTLNIEMNRVLKLGLLIIAPMIFILVSLRSIIIPILYSYAFMPGAELLRIQLWGDLFRLFIWWRHLYYYSTENLKSIVFLELVWSLGHMALSTYLMKSYGLVGVSLSYVIVSGIVMVLAFSVSHQVLRRTVLEYKDVIAKVLLLIGVSMLIPQNLGLWAISSLLLVPLWWLWVLNKTERRQIGGFLREVIDVINNKAAGTSGEV